MNLYDFTTVGISILAIALSIFTLLKLNRNSQTTTADHEKSNTKIAELRKVIDGLQLRNGNEFEDIVLKIQRLSEQFDLSKIEVYNFLREQIAALSIDELRITISKVEARINEFAKASKSSLEYILDLRKIIDNDIKKLYDSLNSEREITTKNIALINEQTSSKLNNIEHRFENRISKIASDTLILQNDSKECFKSFETIEKLHLDFKDEISSLTNKFELEKRQLTETLSELNSKFIEYRGNASSLEDQFESEKRKLTDTISVINQINIDIDSKVASLEDKIESEKESSTSKLSSLKTEVFLQISNLNETVDNIDLTITKTLEPQFLVYNESINSLRTDLNNYNKEIFDQINIIESIYNEFSRNYESFAINIGESVKSIGDKQIVLKLKIKESSDQFAADTKDIEKKIDSTSKSFGTRLKQYTDRSAENYRKIEEAFIIEKLRISKALKLGRTSLSGLQLLFQNKRKVDQLADKNTIRDLQPYVNDVARLGFLNQLAYQRFNRNLDSDVSEEIISSFKKHLNMELSPNKLFYMAHKVWMIEGCCVGRLATNVEDAIIRCLFAYKTVSNNQELRGLEIGTLFGINLCCLAELVSNHTKHFHFTIIDPLEGYYSLSPNDIVVDEPVNESVFFRNVTRYTLKKNVSLIKKFTTQLTKKTLPQKTYNYVLIDGDHTYEGVKLDFELFKNSIEPGGFVIFDDYGTKDWPDVKKYVDKEVDKLDDFAKVLSISRTCVYQKQ